MNCPDDLMTLVLKLPHRPRSAVITNSSTLPPAFGTFRSSSRGWADGSTRDARLFSTRCICEANGRACCVRSCARRSFDAATIFMALVICCVFFTARTRRRRSMSDGISQNAARRPEDAKKTSWSLLRDFVSSWLPLGCCGLPRREVTRIFLYGLGQRGLELIVELLLLRDPAEELRMARLDELVQAGLERP